MSWFLGAIAEAIRTVKEQKTFLVVLIKGTDQESTNTHNAFDNERVKEALNSCICLCLEANSSEESQFSAIYSVIVVPSTYLIDSQGNPLEVLLGESSAERIVEKFLPHITSLTSSRAVNPIVTTEAGSPQTNVTAATEDSTPSSSTQERPNREISLEERVLFARQRLEAKKAEKERAEQERLRQKEMERREVGKQVKNAERTREEQAREEAILERRKIIQEDRLLREKIKRQLEEDKKERATRHTLVSPVVDVGNHAYVTANPSLSQGEPSESCRLQFRFPDGATFSHTFHSYNDTLGNVRQFIQQEAQSSETQKTYQWVADGSFSLAASYPRRNFHAEDESRSLSELHLSPSSALLVLQSGIISVSSGNNGSKIYTMIWRVICYISSLLSFIFRSKLFTSNSSSASPRATQNNAPRSSLSKGAKGSIEDRASTSGTTFRGERRLHDLPRDGDDEATWNGNSTQQM